MGLCERGWEWDCVSEAGNETSAGTETDIYSILIQSLELNMMK